MDTLVRATAFINFFYFYCVDADFGPFFIKFSTYFPFTGVHSAWMHRATFDLVWLGILILTRSVGVPAGPVCPAFPLRFRLGLSAGGRVRPVGVVPGWPGTAGTRPAPTA